MKYYKVQAKCGYVGKYNYVVGDFYVIANDGREAAKLVKTYARVKRNHKDAILNVEEITYGTYKLGKVAYDNDPYMQCHNKQDQALILDKIQDRIFKDVARVNKKDNKCSRQEKSKYGIVNSKVRYDGSKRLRNPYKYYKLQVSNMEAI